MKVSPVNVFTPATEVRDSERFAGRIDELQTLARALESTGVHVVIHGNRGVGKSSLARQLEAMSQGDPALLERLKSPPSEPFDYLPIYFSCDDSVSSIPKLLLRLLSDEDALAAWVPFKVEVRQGNEETAGGIGIKIIELRSKTGSVTTERAQSLETDLVSVFANALKAIADAGVARDGVLLIVDEFDRIRDRSGLASLLKSLDPDRVKVALVGVAPTVQELITEHVSVARQLADGTVRVPPMPDPEMDEVFNRAEALLEGKYVFSPEARTWIIGVAKGHPFYLHLIGKHALLRTIDAGQTIVTAETAQDAFVEIAVKQSAPIQEAAYKTAIGHSYTREVILKRFANVNDEEIHTTELYAELAGSLNVDSSAISVYVGQLASDKYGGVLEKSRERYYRFKDSLVKAYAAARPYQLKKGDREDRDD